MSLFHFLKRVAVRPTQMCPTDFWQRRKSNSMAGWSSQWCRAGVWEPRGVSAGLVVTQSYATAQSSARTGPPMGAGRTGETCGTGVPASTGWLGRCTVVSGGCCHWGRLAKGFMRSPRSWFSAASCDSIVISKSSVQKRDY